MCCSEGKRTRVCATCQHAVATCACNTCGCTAIPLSNESYDRQSIINGCASRHTQTDAHQLLLLNHSQMTQNASPSRKAVCLTRRHQGSTKGAGTKGDTKGAGTKGDTKGAGTKGAPREQAPREAPREQAPRETPREQAPREQAPREHPARPPIAGRLESSSEERIAHAGIHPEERIAP